MIKKLSLPIYFFLKLTKKYSTSKLFIPYNQTSNKYVVIEPFVDLENRLKNINILKDNISLRGLNINVDKISDGLSDYLNARDQLIHLNNEKQKVIEQLKKTKKYDDNEVLRLKENKSKVLTRLKSLRDHISMLEEEVVIPSLELPNTLHPDCPLYEVKILSQYEGKTKIFNEDRVDHIKIGTALDCLEFINSVMVYLKNEASFCEQAIMTYFDDALEQLDFTPLCNSDIIKSTIIEGCGTDYNDADKTFILSDKDLHLVGGASLHSFCAFLTKQSVGGNRLPMRLYTVGRLYKPSNGDDGLFSTAQTNAVGLLIGSMDECQAKLQFDEILTIYKQLYDNIGINYRIVYSPVSSLENWESLRAQVELYSVSRQDYVTVASLSLSGDFISKRLRINWSSKDKHNFLHLVSGKIVDINVLLGCLLEQNVKKFIVPNCLKNFMIS